MAVSFKIEAQRYGDYKSLILADGPVGYWRLSDLEGYAQATKGGNPAGYWRLDEASGNAIDLINANNGTVAGSVTRQRPGALADGNQALGFDGSTAKVTVPDNATLHLGDLCSVVLWLKRSAVGLGTSRMLLEGGTNSIEISVETDDKIKIAKNGVGQIVKATTAISDTTTYHQVVYTKNGATSHVYLDGVDVTGAVTNQTLSNSAGLVFGSSGAAAFYPGDLDEVAYYGRELGATEVAFLYALRLSTISTTSATVLADASGNGHTATVSGGIALRQASGQPDNDACASFDGQHGSGITQATSPLPIPSAITVEAWIYRRGDGADGFEYIWGSGSAISFPIGVALFKPGGNGNPAYLSYYLAYTTATPGWVSTTFVPPLNTWTHVALCADGASVQIYANGVGILSLINSPALTILNVGSTSGVRSIGWQGPGNHEGFNGLLDEVAVYAKMLSPSQIMAHAISGKWTDLTPDRAHQDGTMMTCEGGIDGTGKPDDLLATPGLFTFQLNNAATNSVATAGYYSPNAIACAPGWTDGIRCRLSVTIGSHATFYKFLGWIEDIVPLAGLYQDQVVQVVVSDWLAQASGALAAGVAAQVSQTGDQLVAALVALVSQQPGSTSYDAGADTYLYALDDLDPTSALVLDALRNVALSGLDRIFIKGDTTTGGVLRFESHTLRRSFVTDAFVLTDAASIGQPGLALSDVQAARRRKDRINQVRLTVHPRRIDGSNVVLYSENIIAASSVAIPPAGGSVTIWANYADPNQLAQQVAGASMVNPVATTDFLMNSAANGSGSNLTASCTVVATFFATTAKLVITNNHATLPAYRTFLQLRGLGIYSYQASTVETIGTNQAVIGQRLTVVDMPYQSSMSQAQAAADYLVQLYGSSAWTPADLHAAIVPVSDEATLWTLMTAETSTAYSVTETVMGFMAYPYWVNKWHLEIDERDNCIFTFVPEPRDPNQYWQLGTAGLGELGVTTYLGPF